jgi:hypothetical protein
MFKSFLNKVFVGDESETLVPLSLTLRDSGRVHGARA